MSESIVLIKWFTYKKIASLLVIITPLSLTLLFNSKLNINSSTFSSNSSVNLKPLLSNTLIPLYLLGLWLALIIKAPSALYSFTKYEIAGVGRTSKDITSHPSLNTPAATLLVNISLLILVSPPINKVNLSFFNSFFKTFATLLPIFKANIAFKSSLTIPLIPSVPNNFAIISLPSWRLFSYFLLYYYHQSHLLLKLMDKY